MARIHDGQHQPAPSAKRAGWFALRRPQHTLFRNLHWTWRGWIVATLPVFLVLFLVLSTFSMTAQSKWDINPINRTIAATTFDTAVKMEPTKKSVRCSGESERAQNADTTANAATAANASATANSSTTQNDDTTGLCALSSHTGRYKVGEKRSSFIATQPSTGKKQRINMLIRYPKNFPGKAPGILFMHGAGTFTTDDSFADLMTWYASAGYYTLNIDKPLWDTTAINRDYEASADAYLKALHLLRADPGVNASKVGIYASSESGWIFPVMLNKDKHIAFQVLMSTMSFSPRQALGYFVNADFSIVGAHPGYQGIVHRIFSLDYRFIDSTIADFDPYNTNSYAIPTFLAYGSKDVMTPQVDGAVKLMELARKAHNSNYVIRNYPLANHVLRIGNERDGNTKLTDNFIRDILAWTTGVVKGEKQVNPHIAGEDIYQAITLPRSAHARPFFTGLLLTALVVFLVGFVVSLAFTLEIIIARLIRRLRGIEVQHLFVPGFGRALALLSLATVGALALFGSGLAEVISAVVYLDWGAAPPKDPESLWNSWENSKILGLILLAAWAVFFAALLETAMRHGHLPHLWAMVTRQRSRFEQRRFAKLQAWLAQRNMVIRPVEEAAKRERNKERHTQLDDSSDDDPRFEEGPIACLNRTGFWYALLVIVTMVAILVLFALLGIYIW